MIGSLEKTFDNKLSVSAMMGLYQKGGNEVYDKNKIVRLKVEDVDQKGINYHESQHSKRVQRSRYL